VTEAPGESRGGARARTAPLLLTLLVGCVTTDSPGLLAPGEDPEPIVAEPVVIPLGEVEEAANDSLLLEFYSSVLRRLHDAADDGDVALLDSLVKAYDKPATPDSVRQHLDGFRAMARGIRFRQHVAKAATLELRPPAADLAAGKQTPPAERVAPPLSERLQLDLRIPAMAEPVLLGGLDHQDPFTFSVSVTVEDEYYDGRTRSSHTDGVVQLPQSFWLADGNELVLPVHVGAATDDAVRRSVAVRVDMRGHVQMDEIRSPVKSTTIGAGSFLQFPSGHEVLAKQPLAALKVALADFQVKNFGSAYLAALLLRPEDRLPAAELLIDQIRFGRVDQAQVAMAALKRVSGVSMAIGDRDAWLAWWQTDLSREQLQAPAAGSGGR